MSFELTYPTGSDQKRATVGAGASLEVGTNVKVFATDGAPGMVTSTGRDDENGRCDHHDDHRDRGRSHEGRDDRGRGRDDRSDHDRDDDDCRHDHHERDDVKTTIGADRATRLCTATDSDGDWVPDTLDRCPDTPDLAATDDDGCPLTSLPPAPSADDVGRVFANMHLTINPKCQDAPVPGRVPAGAFYWPAFRERGTYILSGTVQNQPPGCPVWYEFDIEEITGANAGLRYGIVFMDREANTNLVELGRPVPAGFIQFNPRPGDVGGRDRLATTGGVAGIRYRVRAVNGAGVRGAWSDFTISDKASCTALGFKCGGG